MSIRQDENITDMADMTIKFDGHTHQIEANTLINSLIHFTNIVHEVNKGIGNTEKVAINIKAHAPGSFEVVINIVKDLTSMATNLFHVPTSGSVIGLIDSVSALYNLYKFNKGEAPKSVESQINGNVKVENNNGNITYINNSVYNIYTENQSVRNSLLQGFDTLNEDPNVSGLAFIANGEVLVNIPRSEFPELAAPKDDEDLRNDEKLFEDPAANLRIIRLSFDQKMKSDFLYLGNKITAKISDVVFYDKIRNGESIRLGDVLKCRLTNKQSFDPSIGLYVNNNSTYTVVEVLEHLRGSSQSLIN